VLGEIHGAIEEMQVEIRFVGRQGLDPSHSLATENNSQPASPLFTFLGVF
jgi:hypothetical protein